VPVSPSVPVPRRRVGAALIAIAGLALSLLAAPTATARPTGDDGYDPSIIGGTNAAISDAPWQVGLVLNGASSDYQGQFCGGSILSSWEILTAAHCVDYGGDVLTASDVEVLVGTATLSTTRATAVAVASITVHPDWDWTTYENDVAVLRLAAPIALSPGVQEAIPLASSTVADGTSALITGWGNTSTSGSSYPTQLKKATVSTVSDASCNTAYSGDGGIDSGIMLCATGGGFTIDACQGDSGGPLVVSVGGVPTLAGITSFGIGCAEAPYPGVYTEVSAFRTWILAQQTGGPQVERISGLNRYATGVAISQAAFPDPVTSVPVVFIASGTNFPDALSAGPVAAALGGPLLLTNPLALPAEVTAEINRLNPDKIYVVGGTGAVSAAVYTALSGLAPEIERVSGADRYATSRAVTRLGFATASTVYVATGAGFADALSAGAAAGTQPAPVVLVPGTAPSADADTLQLIADLGATDIEVVGGTGVISNGMFASLDGVANAVRRAGADRIATAVAVNAAAFASSEFVYLTNAFSFPDALAGGVLATLEAGPMFTVPTTCVPTAVRSAITALGATDVRLLGGTGVLTVNVAALKTC
jgi:secreted trypsin-like serine protease